MNIFILDADIKKSAMFHTDKHCVKMILEHCQMICTAIIINNYLQEKLDVVNIPYKKTHVNHPCVVWTRKNYENFSWLVAYTNELHEEYKYRYNREHLSYKTLETSRIITEHIIDYGSNLSILELNPACVMPEDCKALSVIDSYRNYYRHYKSQIFVWTKRSKPYWL